MKRLGGVLAACGATAALLAPAALSVADDSPTPPAPGLGSPTATGPAATPTTLAPAATTPAAGTIVGEPPSPLSTTPAQAPNRPPLARLSATPGRPTAGSPVSFDASASVDPDGRIMRYEWDVDDGAYETDGGPTAVHTFDGPGAHTVGVRVTDDRGAVAKGTLSLDVAAAPKAASAPSPAPPAPAPASAAPPAPAPASAAPLKPPSTPLAVAATPARAGAPSAVEKRGRADPAGPPLRARAAATSSVTISDFKFAPGTITVNVGDTVRWTNAGPTGHSATGSGFDTGILAKGASGSATFSKAGTFNYQCTPHPFMKGTIVVKAAGSGSGSGSSGTSGSSSSGTTSGGSSSTGSSDASGSSATPTSSAGGSSSSGSLPFTGTNVALVAAIGFGFLLTGLGLRLVPGARLRRPRPPA